MDVTEKLTTWIANGGYGCASNAESCTCFQHSIAALLGEVERLKLEAAQNDKRLRLLEQYLADTSSDFEHLPTCDSNGCDTGGGCPVTNIPAAFRQLQEELAELKAGNRNGLKAYGVLEKEVERLKLELARALKPALLWNSLISPCGPDCYCSRGLEQP